jgi:Uma2 family endonuclease
MVTLLIPTDAPYVTGPPQGKWTYADWEMLPNDGNRYEVINGVLYVTTAPSFFHQWIVRRLDRFVGVPAEEQGLAFAATAPIGVIMPACDPVQPDFTLVLAGRADIIRERRIMGVPDVIVEVMSPGSTAYDERVKLAAYAAAGVPEYGVIDPAARVVRVYRLEAPGRYSAPRTFDEADALTFDCLPGIAVPVAQLFAGAPDTTW